MDELGPWCRFEVLKNYSPNKPRMIQWMGVKNDRPTLGLLTATPDLISFSAMTNSKKRHIVDAPTLCDATVSRIIEMAWVNRTAFEAIEAQFGLNESAGTNLMRKQMKASSFRLWRKRVTGVVPTPGRFARHRIFAPSGKQHPNVMVACRGQSYLAGFLRKAAEMSALGARPMVRQARKTQELRPGVKTRVSDYLLTSPHQSHHSECLNMMQTCVPARDVQNT
jgi:uncharacterized protein (TIGR03643 family)